MSKKTIARVLISLLIFSYSQTVVIADELMMARSTDDFPETMLTLQTLIKKQGYTLSRIQRVDIGLTKSGYKTDKYRVVFFGKADEIKTISKKLPEIIPYLPLKISIFAENDQTILVTLDPMSFDRMYPNSSLTPVFKRWAKDMHTIFDSIQNLK